MKKSNLIIGIIWLLFGIVCLITAFLMNDRLNGWVGSLYGLGGAGVGSGSIIIYRYLVKKNQ